MLWMAQQPMFNHLSNIGEYYNIVVSALIDYKKITKENN